ncbi:cysteine--1-D-myo-inosityl 2-amino-2-deoxy-alpha-D-glucopyranoside ligase [Salinibacterium sp. G-O1]|uniref:cysteine--1-D-myo-inosityl 2-amino-2-deoxy-alpha-D-glucopyranoside ligase n=1 Tax=Salinibacterium sp. G-O1 TaxID=3046208 RepID=UPI0024BBE4F8|nr:cysteine--1-D-myo-inosityl 2-amino-2-deoxy-alpha-D-glucopyranoside ligase [Salinibacterium sp. G-O1]MDJ0335056.1 cysteine--1-D-myo-inosityl 2-amino-2-deoxy-alpha-D-glucopyranoside ligase [Salinibacterium sp. G-O1]
MKSWNRPEVPRLPGHGAIPRVFDTSTGSMLDTEPIALAGLYVCGITPYDATHIGHAATYLAFDTLIRLWLDAGYDVSYVQNVTDVDDPLLARATAIGVDWRDLAAGQIELFRGDMQALGLVPPDHYVAVTDIVIPVAHAVRRLLDIGIAYRLGEDVYFDSAAAGAASPWHLGQVSQLDRATMLALAAERGGDPEREGKRDPLDPMLWMGARPGEPFWPSELGDGRPGWHIECSIIAQDFLDIPMTVAGGGRDLTFPHHEFTAAHTAALAGRDHALAHVHAGLVSYRGEKMSKSLGNLVFVSTLTAGGVDPRAIRLAILAQHYRTDWEWTDDVLTLAEARLASWERWATETGEGSDILSPLRDALADDLDTPAAVAAVDARIASGAVATPVDLAAIHALLGISLR